MEIIIAHIIYFLLGAAMGLIMSIFIIGCGKRGKELDFYIKGFYDGCESTQKEKVCDMNFNKNLKEKK